MRNSEKLAILTRVYKNTPGTLKINQTTELNGAIRGIQDWPNIHSALSVLVGYTEDGQEIPGLAPQNQHEKYFRELLARYGPATDNFPLEVINPLQEQINGISQHVPVIMHILRQVTPEEPDSALTVAFPGKLSLEDFQSSVAEVGMIIDLLKIENDVNGVWTDSGSTVFGLEIETATSLVVMAAALSGANQFRDVIAAFTPQTIATCFKLFNYISQKVLGNPPLDEKIVEREDISQLVRSFAGTEVTLGLTPEVTNEQKNGLQLAIPKLAELSDKGWQISCSPPQIENSQITQSTIILANTINLALSTSPDAQEESESPTIDRPSTTK